MADLQCELGLADGLLFLAQIGADGRLGLDNPGRPSATMLTLQQWGLSFSLAATLASVAASAISAKVARRRPTKRTA